MPKKEIIVLPDGRRFKLHQTNHPEWKWQITSLEDPASWVQHRTRRDVIESVKEKGGRLE